MIARLKWLTALREVWRSCGLRVRLPARVTWL